MAKKTTPPRIDPDELAKNPHDGIARYFLGFRQIGMDMVKWLFGEQYTQHLDWKSFTVGKDTFTDRRLRSAKADTIYSIKFKGVPFEMELRIIYEFKSQRQPFPVEPQLMKYSSASMENDIQQKKRMALPVPVLFQHGQGKQIPTIEQYFSELPEPFQDFIPNIPIKRVHLNTIPYSEILKINSSLLKSLLLALKYSDSEQELLQHFQEILIFATESGSRYEAENLFHALIVYINQVSNINSDTMTTIIQELPPKVKRKTKSTWEQFEEIWVKKGEKIGIQKGEKIGIQKGEKKMLAQKNQITKDLMLEFPNLSDEKIAKLVKLSTKQVEQIRKSINAKP